MLIDKTGSRKGGLGRFWTCGILRRRCESVDVQKNLFCWMSVSRYRYGLIRLERLRVNTGG